MLVEKEASFKKGLCSYPEFEIKLLFTELKQPHIGKRVVESCLSKLREIRPSKQGWFDRYRAGDYEEHEQAEIAGRIAGRIAVATLVAYCAFYLWRRRENYLSVPLVRYWLAGTGGWAVLLMANEQLGVSYKVNAESAVWWVIPPLAAGVAMALFVWARKERQKPEI
jgi:hypothetical protein